RGTYHPKSIAASFLLTATVCASVLFMTGCKTPMDYRQEADRVSYDIITNKQLEALGSTEAFTIERPSDTLRRRLMVEQQLLTSDAAAMGTDKIEPIEHWPDPNYILAKKISDQTFEIVADKPLKLTLLEALQIGAQNSFTYQGEKEKIFKAALSLDLERNDFRNIFTEQVNSNISSNTTGSRAQSGYVNSSDTGFSRVLKNGASISANFAVDLANLLTLGGASSLGLQADASVSVPLMRGAGEHIVTESLTLAEREVLYTIYEFERYKRTFAVNIATEYYGVLRQLDQIENEKSNYRSLTISVRRSKARAAVGEDSEIDVDQAVQGQLSGRNRWISAVQSYQRALDDFKVLIGLPADANIELESGELDDLIESAKTIIEVEDATTDPDEDTASADTPVVLPEPDYENTGPYEISFENAMKLAIKNRLDLRVSQGLVYDWQRRVVVAADALRAEVTLLGSGSSGSGRSVGTATSDDASVRLDKVSLAALLTIDLPIERTGERNAYRNSLIDLENASRALATLEDQIKLQLRNRLRALLTTRESLRIQAKAVTLAKKRVDSTNMFLEEGQRQIRDLLDAQNDLLSAQNALTSAIVSYRTSELELQKDMGVLKVNEKGLWQEFDPEVLINDQD
ncbi:MAG: TolC family protein, partial [Anaerohalosphaera sp.]|nr:TolC family protein [Anaerohalosphaera sp.]